MTIKRIAVYGDDYDFLTCGDGEFVRYEDHESAIVALEDMIKFLRKELDEQVEYYQDLARDQGYERYLEGKDEGYIQGYDDAMEATPH